MAPENVNNFPVIEITEDPVEEPFHEETVRCHLHNWEGRVRRPSGASDVTRGHRRMSGASDVSRHTHYSDIDPVNNVYDSFEHSLKVAKQMESMLSVYYAAQEDAVTVEVA